MKATIQFLHNPPGFIQIWEQLRNKSANGRHFLVDSPIVQFAHQIRSCIDGAFGSLPIIRISMVVEYLEGSYLAEIQVVKTIVDFDCLLCFFLRFLVLLAPNLCASP